MDSPPESIFKSAFRAFCRMFSAVIGILLAIFFFSILYSLFTPSPLIQEKTKLEILPDAEGAREILPMTTPAILQISVHGVIGDSKGLDTQMMENILLDSRTGLLSHDRVKGILLHINTPGGAATEANNIYQMLKAYKEKYQVPIYAYVDGFCASGGMYIAAATDQIFSSSESVIGSIGVVWGPFFNFYDVMMKVGMQARTLTEGIDKDMMNPTRPFREGEDNSMKAVMDYSYQRFVDIIVANRTRVDKTKLINEYGAQIYDPVRAEEIGYIDHAMSSRNETLRALLEAANLDPKKPYQVVTLSPRHDWMSELVKGKSPLFTGRIEHAIDWGKPSASADPVAYLYRP